MGDYAALFWRDAMIGELIENEMNNPGYYSNDMEDCGCDGSDGKELPAPDNGNIMDRFSQSPYGDRFNLGDSIEDKLSALEALKSKFQKPSQS